MELQNVPKLLPTQPNKTLMDTKEMNRILMQYGGIFKNNIIEYAERLAKVHKKKKNYSR